MGSSWRNVWRPGKGKGGVYIGGGWKSVRNNDPLFFFFFSARNWQVQNFVEDLFDAWGCLRIILYATWITWNRLWIMEDMLHPTIFSCGSCNNFIIREHINFQFWLPLFAHYVLCVYATLKKLNMQNRWQIHLPYRST